MSRFLLFLLGALCVAGQSSLAQHPTASRNHAQTSAEIAVHDRGWPGEVGAMLALHRIRHEDTRGALPHPLLSGAAGPMQLDALATGWASATRPSSWPVSTTRPALSGLASPADVDLGGAVTGGIAGQVSGLTFPQHEGAYVMAWMNDSSRADYSVNYAKVEPDGSYRIESLPAGPYYLMAWADGFEPLYYDNVTNFSDAFTVDVGESVVENIDFDMIPIVAGTGAIVGAIRSDDDGRAVGGANVYAFDPDQPSRYGHAVSADDGSYMISALKSGRYIVQVYADGFLPEFYDDAASYEAATRVEVEEPETVSGVDVSLSEGGTISGIVRDEDGSPLAGVFVWATVPYADSSIVGPDGQIEGEDPAISSWYGYGYGVSNDDGSYRIEGLTSGEYVVLAQTWSSWSYAFQWYDHAATVEDATVVNVAAGDETPSIDFDLAIPVARSSIEGSVYDADGDPIHDAFVLAELLAGDQPDAVTYTSAYAFTDHAGRYVIEGIPGGRYRISAAVQMGWHYVQRWYPNAERPEDAEPVELAEAMTLDGIDLTLPENGGSSSIAGSVVDLTGQPLSNAFIEVSPSQQTADGTWFWAYATTDSSGAYRVDHLPGGSYVVHASYWSGESYGQAWYDRAADPVSATPVILSEDEERTGIDFEVDVRPMYGSVTGAVTGEADAPLRRVYVELQSIARDASLAAPFWYGSMYAVTDDDGQFAIERVPEGTYLLAVYGAGGFEYYEDASSAEHATTIDVTGGRSTGVEIDLASRDDGDGGISGRVTGEDYLDDASDGSPLGVAVVIAEPTPDPSGTAGGLPYVAVSESDGAYRIGGMAPGEYIVSTFAPGYATEYYDDAYSPDAATVVEVDGLRETTGVDFELWPVYYAYLDAESDVARSAVVLFGSVTDSHGTIVDGATVHVLNDAERPVASSRTGADGRFEISGLAPGTYRVFAGKLGAGGGYNGHAASFAEAPPIAVGGGRVEVNVVVSTGTGTGSEDDDPLPRTVELLGNYPNPFNPETTILVRIGAPENVRLVVYNILGERVALLYDGRLESGLHSIAWDGRDHNGRDLASGSYLYRLETGRTVESGAMMLVR